MSADPFQDPGPANLSEAVRHHARHRPDAVALVEHGTVPQGSSRRQVTWRELDRCVDESAEAYDALGLVAGQRVALVMSNTIEAVSAWFGALRGGIVAVPCNPRLTDTELALELADCGATVLLSDDERAVGEHVRQVPLSAHRTHGAGSRVESVPDAEALAAIVFTSGSQGRPRGAMFTHRALVANCRSSAIAGVADPDSVALAMLPLCHMYGLNAIVGVAVYVGATTVLVEGIAPDLGEIIAAEGVTHLPVTPSALYRLLQDDTLAGATALRMVNSGAAPMPTALGQRFTQLTGLRVEQGYGQTEAGPGVSSTLGHELLGPGHVGRALPGVELRIGDGSEPTEPGELFIRGANLFSGYWPDGADAPDAEGWRATGDIAHLRGDDLFLLDRAGELIIVSGFNVYPSEIEEVLDQHESVTGSAVVGAPDERTGERVVAFLEGPRVKPAAVRAHAAAHLARYKVPADFFVLKKIPRTSTGKPRKAALRDMLDVVEDEA